MLSDAEFLEQFDAGTLDLETFDHTAHFRAAWLCLREAPFRDALGRLRRGLKRLAISAGRPQRYHETITVAYARLIARQMRALGNPPWDEFRARSAELFAPGLGAIRSLYDPAIIDSPEARKIFVPPPAWNSERKLVSAGDGLPPVLVAEANVTGVDAVGVAFGKLAR